MADKIDVYWKTKALSILGSWGRVAYDSVLTEFTDTVSSDGPSFGESSGNNLRTARVNDEFFVLSEILPGKKMVVVHAVSRSPEENERAKEQLNPKTESLPTV